MAKLDLPFSIEAPEKQPAEPMKPSEQELGGIPGYVEPWARCANCEYFSPDDSMCQKYKANCDMDGSCPSFEEAGEEENGGDEPETPGKMEEEGEGDD